VSSILQASLTGAGLVLAVYTLIIPVSGKLFVKRAKELTNEINHVKNLSEGISTATTFEELEELATSIKEIKEKGGMPQYLGIGIGLTFFGFIVSCLMSIWWNIGWYFDYMDDNLPNVFGLTIAMFLLIGIVTVKDIYETMKSQYQIYKSIVTKLKNNKSVVY